MRLVDESLFAVRSPLWLISMLSLCACERVPSAWTINVQHVPLDCSRHHSESGSNISFWWWLLLNLHPFGRVPVKWNPLEFQTIIIINLVYWVVKRGISRIFQEMEATSIYSLCHNITMTHPRSECYARPFALVPGTLAVNTETIQHPSTSECLIEGTAVSQPYHRDDLPPSYPTWPMTACPSGPDKRHSLPPNPTWDELLLMDHWCENHGREHNNPGPLVESFQDGT